MGDSATGIARRRAATGGLRGDTVNSEGVTMSVATYRLMRRPPAAALLAMVCSAYAMADHPVAKKGLVDVRLRERGAHLIETFSGDAINEKVWRIWITNPERAKLYVKAGRFWIEGVDRLGHNGLWHLDSAKYKDVTLIGRMDIRSQGPDPHQLLLHLCGGDMPLSPDHWAEVIMQDAGEGKVRFGTLIVVDTPNRVSGPKREVTLERGQTDGFLAKVSLHAGDNSVHLAVRDTGGAWHTLGDPATMYVRTTHCEIKMRRSWSAQEGQSTKSVGWFDDVRIYPRADTHPVLFRIVMADGRNAWYRDGDRWPPEIHVAGQEPRNVGDLVVELLTADGHLVSRTQSENMGHYMLPVVYRDWDVFPVAATVRLSIDGKTLGQVAIPKKELQGLYPDDVWDLVLE